MYCNYSEPESCSQRYYLKHLFNGKWNSFGCVFLDSQNTPGFSDRHTIRSLFSFHIRTLRNLVLLEAQPCKGQHNCRQDCIQDGPHGKGVKNQPADLIGNIFTNFRHDAAVRQQEQGQVVCPGCPAWG